MGRGGKEKGDGKPKGKGREKDHRRGARERGQYDDGMGWAELEELPTADPESSGSEEEEVEVEAPRRMKTLEELEAERAAHKAAKQAAKEEQRRLAEAAAARRAARASDD